MAAVVLRPSDGCGKVVRRVRVVRRVPSSLGREWPITSGARSSWGPVGASHAYGSNEEQVSTVPTGKVKWYDSDKGFGFLTQEGGADVYVHKAALPAGVEALKPGQRVEFGVAEGRRGSQALQVRLIETPPSAVEGARRPAEDLHSLIEDMIRLLEDKVQPDLRRGRYPERKSAKLAAEVVRAVARDLDG